MLNIYFSDFFQVSPEKISEYGAFNISLINDLPLFIDPFLIFNSKESELQKLHNDIINYLVFLKNKSLLYEVLEKGVLEAWFVFREVKQTWLGFSKTGNDGSGLGPDFGRNLHRNFRNIFSDFGEENITLSSHIERLCLIEHGVGKDNISDFTTTLIKEYLVEYTQAFAQAHIEKRFRERVSVPKIRFNYETESWEPETYDLPVFQNDFVLLTPRKLLTKEKLWVNRKDMIESAIGYHDIAIAIPNEQLRFQVNNYFLSILPRKPKGKLHTKDELRTAVEQTIRQFPELIQYYIRQKEEQGDIAEEISLQNVTESERLYIEQVERFVKSHLAETDFYKIDSKNSEEAHTRLLLLKEVIEANNAQWLLHVEEKPISTENELGVLLKLIWLANQENSKAESIDFLPELKLATNTQLKKKLEKIVGWLEQKYPSYLLDTLKSRFNEDELRTFCIHLNSIYEVEYENLSAHTLQGKIRELISHSQRYGKLLHFVEEGKRRRPEIPWEIEDINEHLCAIIYFSEKEYERVTMLLDQFLIRNNPNIILINGHK